MHSVNHTAMYLHGAIASYCIASYVTTMQTIVLQLAIKHAAFYMACVTKQNYVSSFVINTRMLAQHRVHLNLAS